MKRTTRMALVTGAAVLLAGCSSNSGTASPVSSSTAGVAATPANTVSSAMSSNARSSSAVSASPVSSSPVSSSPEPSLSSSAAAGESPTGSTASGVASSSAESGITTGTSSTSKAAATTIGNTSGALDAQSAAWLSTFCAGLGPVASVARDLRGLSSPDTTTQQKTAVTLYQTFGSSFTVTGKQLKSLPAPTFPGGQDFAGKVIKAFQSAGPVFTASAKKIAAIDLRKNAAALQAAIDNLPSDLQSASGPLSELDNLKLTPQTAAAFEKLPACARINAKVTR